MGVRQRGVPLRRRQGGIVGVSSGAAVEEARANGKVERRADPQALDEIGIGDIEPPERDQVRKVAAPGLEGSLRS